MNSIILKTFFIYVFLASSVYASGLKNINNDEFKQLMEQGVAVIDVRTPSEWNKTGVVEGSHLLMFYDDQGKYDLNAWLEGVAEIASKEEPLILICHSGGRTKQLGKYLANVAGYQEVYNVKRGIAYWIKKNNSVVMPN
jgi:rhodanese-related sulfurtransferase